MWPHHARTVAYRRLEWSQKNSESPLKWPRKYLHGIPATTSFVSLPFATRRFVFTTQHLSRWHVAVLDITSRITWEFSTITKPGHNTQLFFPSKFFFFGWLIHRRKGCYLWSIEKHYVSRYFKGNRGNNLSRTICTRWH